MELTIPQINRRAVWVRDLVSGEFKQGSGALKSLVTNAAGEESGHVYCCLGVACERIDPENVVLIIGEDLRQSAGLMNDEFAIENFGLNDVDQTQAAGWNDEEEFPLTRIADLIAYATVYHLYLDRLDELMSQDPDFSDDDPNTPAISVPEGFATKWLVMFEGIA